MRSGFSDIDVRSGAAPSRPDIVMISRIRIVLALSALAIFYFDPSQPARLVGLTSVSLTIYTIYSIIIYALSVSRSPKLPLRVLHWIDLAWYLELIALTNGTNSIFFFFLFFAILVASFWWGLVPGLSTTIVAVILFTLIGYFTAPRNVEFQLNRFLLRSIYVLVLGYLIAYWGGYEVRLKNRLQFLKDINQLSNPRFGIGRTTSWIMSRLCEFYRADTCLLVLRSDSGEGYSLRRVDAGSENGKSATEISGELAITLLFPSPHEAVIYRRHPHDDLMYDIFSGETAHAGQRIESVANALDASSFVSVPIRYRREPIGRMYLIGRRAKFSQSDIDFIMQAIDQVIPVLDNIRLVDELASNAADEERQKIARDIHDSIIQPYIGLKLGLTAVSQKLERGDNRVLDDVKNLSDLVLKQIADLRYYIGGLKGGESESNVLIPAIRRFASRFSQATGIDVKINAPENIRINDRLAAELFHMITEGLSNVRRHTQAQRAEAVLICRNDHMVLQIENENPNGSARPSFHPRSLASRAEALGGELTVFSDEENRTIVNIQIPL